MTALLGIALAVIEGLSGMALVALSSTVHMLKVRERNRVREASEGKRLYAAIKYGIDYGIDGNPSVTGDGLSEGEGPQ